MLALLQHPDQLARWRADPTLAPAAVEELLRWDSPVQMNMRTALEPVDIAGEPLEPGDVVIVLQGGANRDPAHFTDADTFDVGRPDNTPLSFGWGIHHCLGAALARMEGEVVFNALLSRCRRIDARFDERRDLLIVGFDHLLKNHVAVGRVFHAGRDGHLLRRRPNRAGDEPRLIGRAFVELVDRPAGTFDRRVIQLASQLDRLGEGVMLTGLAGFYVINLVELALDRCYPGIVAMIGEAARDVDEVVTWARARPCPADVALIGGLALSWFIGPVWELRWDPLAGSEAMAEEFRKEHSDVRVRVGPEGLELVVGQRLLPRGAQQVGSNDVGVRRVDHGGLGRPVEQVRRVRDEVLVEWLVLRHEHGERAVRPPPRPTRLLPHRRPGARVADEDRRVERADVDPELERVRRRDREQLVGRELAFELAPVLREVPGAVRLDAPTEIGVEIAAGEPGQELGGAP